jgi:hypothetical protein
MMIRFFFCTDMTHRFLVVFFIFDLAIKNASRVSEVLVFTDSPKKKKNKNECSHTLMKFVNKEYAIMVIHSFADHIFCSDTKFNTFIGIY